MFHQFFDKKVAAVHDLLADASPLHFPTPVAAASLSDFQAVAVDDVTSAIRRLPNKHCVSDPIPSHLLVSIVDDIAPFLTALYNKSLQDGVVPESYKSAYISPLLRKSNPDPTDVKSCRPMSNLPVTSKLLERLVAKQLASITFESPRSIAENAVRLSPRSLNRDSRN